MAVTTKRTITPTEIISAERQRIMAILESPEGLKNPEAARKMAFAGMLPDQARDILAGLPAANPYLAALDREAATGISPGHSGDVFAAADPKAERLKEIKKNVGAFAEAKGYR